MHRPLTFPLLLATTLPLTAQAPELPEPTILGTPIRIHDGIVSAAAFAADGRLAMSVSMAGDLTVWDAATGERLRSFDCRAAPQAAAWCGAKSDRIAVLDPTVGVRILDAKSGEVVVTKEGLRSLAGSPDQSLLASITAAGEVVLLDARSGETRATIPVGEDAIAPVFSPDGGLVVVADLMTGGTTVIDTTAAKVVFELDAQHSGRHHVVLPGGDAMLVSSGARLRKVALPSGEELASWQLGAGPSALASRNDGAEALLGFQTGQIAHLDLVAGELRHAMYEHRGLVNRLSLSPDGNTLLSGSWDGTVRFWDLATGAERFLRPGHNNAVTAVAWAPGGAHVASGAWDNTTVLWSADGAMRHANRVHEYLVTAVAFAADGSFWSASQDGSLRHWAPDGEALRVLSLDPEGVHATCVVRCDDGASLLAGMSDGSLRWLDPTSGALQRRVEAHDGEVVAIAIDATSGAVVSGGIDGTVEWLAADGTEPQHSFTVHDDGVLAVALAGAVVFASGADGTLVRFDTATGRETHRIRFGTDFARDLDHLALWREHLVGAAGDLCWFRTDDLTALGETPAPAEVTSLAVAPDGDALAAGLADGTIALFRTGQTPRK